MSLARRYLWLTALCTLLFLVLLLIGSWLLLEKQTALAVVSFVAAFGSVGGQMASLALFLKHKHRQALLKAQNQNKERKL